MMTVYLSLGSNLGDRLQNLILALARLEGPDLRVAQVSSVYETAPQGKVDQPSFLNMAVTVETHLPPLDMLARIHSVEQSLGRMRRERWGPRTIDIDMLLYGQLRLEQPELVVPHPRMAERAFVLIPLLDLTPDLVMPDTGIPLAGLRATLPDQGVVRFRSAESFQQLRHSGPTESSR